MFRYNFVPMQAQTERSKSRSPIRAISTLIDELTLLLQQEAARQGGDRSRRFPSY